MAHPILKAAVVSAVLAGFALACTPSIGDKCTISTDCSQQGDRLCDTSQPNGYCTQLNCVGNKCADDALCILFNAATPGCTYSDRSGSTGSRVSRSFCMAECKTNSDCRTHYVCADPRTYPWGASILDNDQTRKACLPEPLENDAGAVASAAPVCGPSAPAVSAIDAGAAVVFDAGVPVPPLFPDAGSDAGRDAGADGG